MKRTSLFMSMMLLSMIGLCSCLSSGDNKEKRDAMGVLEMSGTGLSWVLNSTVGAVSSPQLSQFISENKMQPGNCYIFNFEINYSLPENSYATAQSRGFYTVTILEYNELPQYSVSSYLPDTQTVMQNETALVNGYYMAQYGGNYLFIQHIVNQPSDAELQWEMAYDYNSIYHPADIGGVRYYDLYLRATTLKEGTKSKTDVAYLNAYYMSDFLQSAAQNEKYTLGSSYNPNTSTFKVRINYVMGIKDNVITWQNAVADVFVYSFAGE